jgi:hypothetical protein
MKNINNIKVMITWSLLAVVTVLTGCGQVSSQQANLPGNPDISVTLAPITTILPGTTAPVVDKTQPTTSQPAVEMDLAQLAAEYKADPVAAAAKYEGKRYVFHNVTIEEMSELYKPPSPDQYIVSRGFKFRPDFLAQITPLKVGYIVNVEGIIGPVQWGYVTASHCSYNIVDGSNGLFRPDYQNTFG